MMRAESAGFRVDFIPISAAVTRKLNRFPQVATIDYSNGPLTLAGSCLEQTHVETTVYNIGVFSGNLNILIPALILPAYCTFRDNLEMKARILMETSEVSETS